MISKGDTNLWSWKKSANLPYVHAEIIKPTVTTNILINDQHDIGLEINTGSRFPNAAVNEIYQFRYRMEL